MSSLCYLKWQKGRGRGVLVLREVLVETFLFVELN